MTITADTAPHEFVLLSQTPRVHPPPTTIFVIPCFSLVDRDHAVRILKSVKNSRIRNYENLAVVVARCECKATPITSDREINKMMRAINDERKRILELLGVEPIE